MARYKGKEYTVKKVARHRVVLVKDDGLLIAPRKLVELTKKERKQYAV